MKGDARADWRNVPDSKDLSAKILELMFSCGDSSKISTLSRVEKDFQANRQV